MYEKFVQFGEEQFHLVGLHRICRFGVAAEAL